MKAYSNASHDRRETLGLLLGAVGVLTFSLTLPASRVAVPVFGGWTVGIGRAVVAGALAAVALTATRSAVPARATLRRLGIVVGGVVIGFPLLTALAVAHVPASRGAIVIGLLPGATALAATLRHGERPSRTFWLAAAVGVSAVTVFAVATGSGGLPEPADLLLLGAVGTAAVGYAEGGAIARELGGWRTICWALVLALPLTVPITAVAVVTHGRVEPTASSVLGFAYVAVGSMFLGFFAWYAGLAIGGTARVSQLQLLQPIATLAWSALLLGETLTTGALVTAAVVLGAVAIGRRAAVAPAPQLPATQLPAVGVDCPPAPGRLRIDAATR